jgi:hypothetical protein
MNVNSKLKTGTNTRNNSQINLKQNMKSQQAVIKRPGRETGVSQGQTLRKGR